MGTSLVHLANSQGTTENFMYRTQKILPNTPAVYQDQNVNRKYDQTQPSYSLRGHNSIHVHGWLNLHLVLNRKNLAETLG